MMCDILVAGIAFFAALAWGANEEWAIALVAASSLLTLAFRLIWNSNQNKPVMTRNAAIVPLVVFPCYVGLQLLFPNSVLPSVSGLMPHTVEHRSTLLYLLLVLACLALALVVAIGFDSRTRVKGLVYVIMALGVVEALYGLAQYLGGYGYIWNFRVTCDFARGTFINRNHYALLLNLALCAGIGYLYYRSMRLLRGRGMSLRLILASPGSGHLMWIVLWLALIGLAITMSMSRMGIIAMFGGIGIMLIAGIVTAAGKRTMALGIAVLSVIVSLAIYTGIDEVLTRYENMAGSGYFERERIPIWREAVRMIRQDPITGTGLGTFQWTFGAFERQEPDTPAQYAHNDYIQALAEVGAVGLLILLTAFALLWRDAIKNLKFQGDPLVQGIGLMTLGALTATALQEMTDFSLYIPGTAICFSILIGLNLRGARLRRDASHV